MEVHARIKTLLVEIYGEHRAEQAFKRIVALLKKYPGREHHASLDRATRN